MADSDDRKPPVRFTIVSYEGEDHRVMSEGAMSRSGCESTKHVSLFQPVDNSELDVVLEVVSRVMDDLPCRDPGAEALLSELLCTYEALRLLRHRRSWYDYIAAHQHLRRVAKLSANTNSTSAALLNDMLHLLSGFFADDYWTLR